MEKFKIKGGLKLEGDIKVSGAKNLALKIIPASILSGEEMNIKNLPDIEDVDRAIELARDLGAEIEREKDKLRIRFKELQTRELKPEIANKFRASIMFVAPILARFGEVKFPHPGGCVIGAGSRPIDLFLEAFQALGAEIKHKDGFYHIKAKKLRACDYFFTTISVTGTESIMIAACLAEGKSIIRNCAMEPEIIALADYLNSQGAKIKGAGTPTMLIEGVPRLSAGNFKIIPDRIETGTFAILSALNNGKISIRNCDTSHIDILLKIFQKIGIKFRAGKDFLEISPNKIFRPYSIKTHEYPGFPTDLQSPYTLLMTQAQGSSIVQETIYDRRLLFTDLLTQMGANIIICDPHRVVVNGPTPLYGKKLTSPDLRAGITMILAGLIAQGETTIDNIYQIDRGYENIDTRLKMLGADIERLKD